MRTLARDNTHAIGNTPDAGGDLDRGDAKDGAQAAFRHDKLPVVAKTYYLQMLSAKLDTRRNKREVFTLCTVLDHLCLGEYELSYKFMDALIFSL